MADMQDVKNAADGAKEAAHKAAQSIDAAGKHIKAQWIGIAVLAVAVIGIGGSAIGLF